MAATDISTTLLYIFLAMMQNYILFSVGLITGLKKIWNHKSILAVSELLVNCFLPIYATLELARMASWPNIEIMWILIVSVFVSIFVGFFIAVLLHKIFNLDVRFSRSYPYLVSMPSMGTLPLVLGKALCYPGGMLDGDSQCKTILGFMMMNFLIFQMISFVMGFILMPKDADLTNQLTEKMSYIWHFLIKNFLKKNYLVLNIFLRFMKDEKTAKKLFEVFEKKYKLEITESDNLHLNYKFIEDSEIHINFILDEPHLAHHHSHHRSNSGHHEIEVIKEETLDNNPVNNSNFENSEGKSPQESVTEERIDVGNSINYIKQELEPETLPNHTQMNEIEINNVFLTERETLKPFKERKASINIPHNKQIMPNIEVVIQEKTEEEPCREIHLSHEMNYVQSELFEADMHHQQLERMSVAEEKNIVNQIELRRKSLVKIFATDVERYYQKVFGFVEKHLNEQKASEYNEFKLTTFLAIFGIPPKFPTVKNVEITANMVKVVEEEWIKFESRVKKINPEFKLATNNYPLSISLILSKVHSPPIIGCFLGLLIGMSGLREVLFSSNHYVSNLVDGIEIITKASVPFLYVALGVSMLSIKTFNPINTPLSAKYIILTFLHRFIILPGIGLFYVYLWKTYYGGIVSASEVFRISLFIPFCLPCTATIVVIVNILKFFSDETGITLFSHNTTIVITLTTLYLIYYVVIG